MFGLCDVEYVYIDLVVLFDIVELLDIAYQLPGIGSKTMPRKSFVIGYVTCMPGSNIYDVELCNVGLRVPESVYNFRLTRCLINMILMCTMRGLVT